VLRWAACCLLLFPAVGVAQSSQKTVAKNVSAHRTNEFTLAGLRPGRDTLAKAKHLYQSFADPEKEQGQSTWDDACRKSSLVVTYDEKLRIETIRVSQMKGSIDADCFDKAKRIPWRTGQGLAISDPTTKLAQLYGEPDSKSPSTRDGQPLELWYYAFDWAGPDVPQVMEVLCTRGSPGQPGRVVEITLAAPSL
jgi:hypothetical protein